MSAYRRDIFLVLKSDNTQANSINTQVEYLNEIVARVDNIDGFCKAHELVNRNRITNNKRKIMAAVENERLKPFRFLINKN